MAWAGHPIHPKAQSQPNRARCCVPSPKNVARCVFLLSVGAFFCTCHAGAAQPACPPLLSGQPFIVFWGIPDSSCSSRSDPTSFGMERAGRVAVFYEDTLGNYPYFLDKNTPVNGGIPQYTRLDSHIQKTKQDLEAALPAPRYLGLGVLRWAEWLPQWSRNREKRSMYLEASRRLLRTFFPKWTPEEVDKWSRVDFEAAAQSIMIETLREVKRLRPKALWGFSPYPYCYSSDPTQTQLANYSGQCPPAEAALNDELLWLWKRCSALYPLLTLEKFQGGTPSGRAFLSAQIKEAMRVSSLAEAEFDLPVFPLVRSVYTSTKTFLSQPDLLNMIGESAAMGTAGVVIWDRGDIKTERECQDLSEFVTKVLGPYSINVTKATQLCSSSLCQGKGRCVRQNPDSSAYLHLPPQLTAPEKAEVANVTSQPDLEAKPTEPDPAEIWKKDFQCQWYQTGDGDASEQQSPKDGAPDAKRAEKNTGNLSGTSTFLTSKSASESELKGRDFSSARSPSASPADSGADALAAANVKMLLLLLGAGGLFL